MDWTGCALCAEGVWKCRQPTLLRGLRRRQGTLRDVGTGGGARLVCTGSEEFVVRGLVCNRLVWRPKLWILSSTQHGAEELANIV